MGSPDVDYLTPILQLVQRRARDGRISNHALVSAVRLTIETNIMTSKSLPGPDTPIVTLSSLSYGQYRRIASGRRLPSESFCLAREHATANIDASVLIKNRRRIGSCARTYPSSCKFLSSNDFGLSLAQHISSWEAVSQSRISVESSRRTSLMHHCRPILVFDRYSNTLLVSLNNRISIRDTSVACGGVVRSPAGPLPSTTHRGAMTDIILMDMEKSSNSSKTPPL